MTTQESTDDRQIRDLVSRLGDWLDGRGGDPASIYDADVRVNSPRGEVRGLAEVLAHVGPPTGAERWQHFHTDTLVELDGDTAMATANQLVQFFEAGRPPHRTSGLRVGYRFARRADGWRMVEAEIALQWIIGDLPASVRIQPNG